MNNLNIRKGDTVVVLSGKDKGRQGKVLATVPKDQKVIVEGINIVTRHTRPRKQTDPGGIVRKEGPIYVCKVMRVCPKCKKRTRTAHEIDAESKIKYRVCKHCGDII